MSDIEISQVVDVSKFATIVQEATNQIVLLPNNIESTEGEQNLYASSLPTVLKLARQHGLPVAVHGDVSSSALLEQRSVEWFGPAIFVSSLFASQNPHAVSVALSMLANYLTTLFSGRSDASANLDIYVRQDRAGTITKIKYNGAVSGIVGVKDTVDRVLNGQSSSDEQ
jgi:hypothetical protein